MDDWLKIRTEYITTNASYSRLSEKYGVDRSLIGLRGKNEGWVQQRKQYRDKLQTKTVEKIAESQAKKAAKINDLADKLLLKLEAAVDSQNLDPKSIRSLTASLRELKEIKGELSELDRREQEARIANLQRQAEKGDNAPGSITVNLGGLEKYAQ